MDISIRPIESFATVVFCGLGSALQELYSAFAEKRVYRTYLCSSLEEGLATRLPSPCVFVVDEHLLDREAGAELRMRAARDKGTQVIAIVHSPNADAMQWLRNGCVGCLEPECGAEVAHKAVQSVLAGEVWADRKAMSSLLRSMFTKVNEAKFTKRETEILQRVMAGMDNRSIAEDLFITRETVRWHLRSAYSKLGVHDRQALCQFG